MPTANSRAAIDRFPDRPRDRSPGQPIIAGVFRIIDDTKVALRCVWESTPATDTDELTSYLRSRRSVGWDAELLLPAGSLSGGSLMTTINRSALASRGAGPAILRLGCMSPIQGVRI